MLKYRDERFEFVFDTLCRKIVELRILDREINTISSLIDSYDDTCIAKRLLNPIKSLGELKNKLTELQNKRLIIVNDYKYYVDMYNLTLNNKKFELINKSTRVFTEKEIEIKQRVLELEAENADIEKINFYKELSKVYYEQIESLYAFLDENNNLKNKYKKPM